MKLNLFEELKQYCFNQTVRRSLYSERQSILTAHATETPEDSLPMAYYEMCTVDLQPASEGCNRN